MRKRKIAVVTGSRAEYGILKPLLHLLVDRNDLELSLLVTGLHLLEEYGHTISEIENDGFPIDAVVEMYDESEDSKIYYGLSLAKSIKGFTEELSRISPDFLVVLGDRLEPMAATLAGALLRIPVAHIHGGDRTDAGLFDGSIRHSISRFASLHLVAIDEHRNRLIKMGEEPSRIHVVGSMGLDTIVKRKPISRKKLSEKIGFDLDDQTILLIFHPESIGVDVKDQIREICEALKDLKLKTLVLYPNNDPGNEAIIAEIEKMRELDFIKIIKSLPHGDYVDVMKHIGVMIGNSSSGIIEASSLKLPVINIGSRQKSRERSMNVIDVSAKKTEILEAIRKALHDDAFRQALKAISNPYGDGETAERIVEILRKTKIDSSLLRKTITY